MSIDFLLFIVEPSNPPLERGTHYAVFVRGYVTDDVFQSTDWYPVVQTEEEKNHCTLFILVCHE